jgi:hypothetical protein
LFWFYSSRDRMKVLKIKFFKIINLSVRVIFKVKH